MVTKNKISIISIVSLGDEKELKRCEKSEKYGGKSISEPFDGGEMVRR